MIEAITHGLLTGLMLSLVVGTTFFALIELSISKGLKYALVMNIGVIVSDALVILSCWIIPHELISSIFNSTLFAYFSSLVFITIGLLYIFSKIHKPKNNEQSRNLLIFKLFVFGITVNLSNPQMYLVWFGVSIIPSKENYDNVLSLMFFSSIIGLLCITDFLKIYFASKLKRIIRGKTLKAMQIIGGLLFIIFGIYLLINYTNLIK